MELKRPESIIEQINQIIRSRIQQGQYTAGCRLPSETALASEFNVSRTSIRNAMNSLVNEGVIIRRHGDGTYINKRVYEFTTQLKNLWSFPDLIEDSGYKSSVSVLSITHFPATADLAADLDVHPGTNLMEIQRLFFADTQPVIFSRNFIPQHLLLKSNSNSHYNTSIYSLMLEYASIELGYSTSDIHSIQADETLATHLSVPKGYPLLHFRDVFFTADSNPVVIGSNAYNDKLLTMRLVRTRGQ